MPETPNTTPHADGAAITTGQWKIVVISVMGFFTDAYASSSSAS